MILLLPTFIYCQIYVIRNDYLLQISITNQRRNLSWLVEQTTNKRTGICISVSSLCDCDLQRILHVIIIVISK